MIGSPFFLCEDGKAQVLMGGCQNWKAESPGATVYWIYMQNLVGQFCKQLRVGLAFRMVL